MEFMPWVAGTVVFVVLAAATAVIFHRPAPTDMDRVKEIANAFNGAESQVLKATVMPGYVSFVRQDKETHETARVAIQTQRSGRFNSTICSGVTLDPAAAAAQAGVTAAPAGGGVTISPVFNNYGGGQPAPQPQITPQPAAEGGQVIQVRDLREEDQPAEEGRPAN